MLGYDLKRGLVLGGGGSEIGECRFGRVCSLRMLVGKILGRGEGSELLFIMPQL